MGRFGGILDREFSISRCTVLIETLPAAFQMHEILHALKDRILGLNCGRWDYIFSYIKTFRHSPRHILPDRFRICESAAAVSITFSLVLAHKSSNKHTGMRGTFSESSTNCTRMSSMRWASSGT